MMTAEEGVKNLTLALIYLTRQADKKDELFGNGPSMAWKNYNWETIDELNEEGFISSKHGNKSLCLNEEGVEKVREILAELGIEDWKSEDIK